MSVEDEILLRISPSKEKSKEILDAATSLEKNVREVASRYHLNLEVVLVGSVAKGTFLSDPDIDIFVMFPTAVSREELEKAGLSIGEEAIGGEERYAEHPYIHGRYRGFEADIVPCYKLTDASELKSSVDRTPFHTEFIRKNLLDEQKEHVRLLKQFMKGIGVYGAESQVQGFSGYLAELLILKYGNFKSVVEAAAKWHFNTVISLTKGKEKEFNDPLVFYDPIDPKRNVASALSIDSFGFFIFACKEYIRNPSERFFFPSRRDVLELRTIRSLVKERGTSIVIVKMHKPDINDENLYPQMKKTLDGIVSLLRDNDFSVIDKSLFAGESKLFFSIELLTDNLPRLRKHMGPPVWIANAESFLDKWEKKGWSEPFIENGRWVVMAKRDHTSAKRLLEEEMRKASLGSDLRSLKGLDVKTLRQIRSKEYERPLSLLLDKRKPWEL